MLASSAFLLILKYHFLLLFLQFQKIKKMRVDVETLTLVLLFFEPLVPKLAVITVVS